MYGVHQPYSNIGHTTYSQVTALTDFLTSTLNQTRYITFNPKPNLKPDGVHNPNPLAVANIPWSQCRPERLSDQPEIECVIQRTWKMYMRFLQLHVLVVFYIVPTIIALVDVLPLSSWCCRLGEFLLFSPVSGFSLPKWGDEEEMRTRPKFVKKNQHQGTI